MINDKSHEGIPSGHFATVLRADGFLGDCDNDSALRAAMSTDGSIYQIIPDMVVAPKTAFDLVVLLRVLERAEFHDIAVTARGGGTGTNGQSLNRASSLICAAT